MCTDLIPNYMDAIDQFADDKIDFSIRVTVPDEEQYRRAEQHDDGTN